MSPLRKDYTGDEEFFLPKPNSKKLKHKKKDKGKKKSKKNFK